MENRDNGTGSTLDSKLDSIKDSVKGLVDENRQKIKNRVIDAKDQAMARGNMYVDRVTDMIKANPVCGAHRRARVCSDCALVPLSRPVREPTPAA